MKTGAFLVVAVVASCASAFSQASSIDITGPEIKAHVRYLASDELHGRKSGSTDDATAAHYIADQLKSYGLQAAGDSGTYFQHFTFISSVRLGIGNALAVIDGNGAIERFGVDTDFRPLSFTSNDSLTAPIVFVGYGISAPDLGYDDYAGVSVEKKVVVVLRFGPDGDKPQSKFSRFTSPRNKARIAREKGAACIIVITGPADDQEDNLLRLSFDQIGGSSGIPALTVKRSILLPLLERRGLSLKAIQDSIASTQKPHSFEVAGSQISVRTDVEEVTANSANVLGFLPGSDPAVKDQVLVLGAHFDHIGMGGEGSGSPTDTGAVYHGADDNASGTAGLLELAQKFASENGRIRRTVVFAFFSGEELGTLGSLRYVNSPPFPLERTVAMLNMDMIGRLSGKVLTVYGTGTSPSWIPLLQRYNADSSFTLTMMPDGYGPSDHSSFYAKNIPVLHFFTGAHSDTHKPTDTWNRLDFDGEEHVVRYVYEIAENVLKGDARPAYTRVETSTPQAGGDRRSFSVTLGIIPDFSGSTNGGMKITGVRPKGAAEKAGLASGDVLVKMAGKKVLNIYDYMGILGELKAGDVVEVEVMRDGKSLTARVTMERRQ